MGSAEGSYFKYIGQTDFALDIDTELNEQAILDSIAILHKDSGEYIPDEDCAKLTISDETVTFDWNEPVNMHTIGEYSGTVCVNGAPVQAITVHVQDHSAVFNAINDPSTSRIETVLPLFPLMTVKSSAIKLFSTLQMNLTHSAAMQATNSLLLFQLSVRVILQPKQLKQV